MLLFWKEGRKDGHVLFNDALNTFCLRLYGVRHMVKDHTDSEKGNCCHHMGYSFQLAARFFYMHHPTYRIIHTTVFVTPVMEHWLEREIIVLICCFDLHTGIPLALRTWHHGRYWNSMFFHYYTAISLIPLTWFWNNKKLIVFFKYVSFVVDVELLTFYLFITIVSIFYPPPLILIINNYMHTNY